MAHCGSLQSLIGFYKKTCAAAQHEIYYYFINTLSQLFIVFVLSFSLFSYSYSDYYHYQSDSYHYYSYPPTQSFTQNRWKWQTPALPKTNESDRPRSVTFIPGPKLFLAGGNKNNNGNSITSNNMGNKNDNNNTNNENTSNSNSRHLRCRAC